LSVSLAFKCHQPLYLFYSFLIPDRLRDAGHDVSANPTTKEIEEAREKFEIQKDLQDIDPQLILSNSKRRLDSTSGTSGGNTIENRPQKRVASEGSAGTTAPQRARAPPPDEEEEAQF
jgi:hypothetical protein